MADGRAPGLPAGGEAGWYDISLPLTGATAAVPGDPPFRRRLFLRHETDGCEAGAWRLSAHAGTHLDFPAHFFPNGKRAGDYPAAAFVLPALVVDCGQAWTLGPDVLSGLETVPGEAVLLRTRNSTERLFAGPEFPETFAAANPALALELVRRQAGLVGIDGLSIEPLADPLYPVHNILLGAGLPILEGLVLAAVPPGRHTLSCLPLAVPEAEASPVRAILFPACLPGGRPA
ncbi:Arylformamidase [Solidesulfovibrio carbinoliphilus subsp. oakridgensis]|uniref:Arylformamidase n=1 Tax=Solidesulfovibrio carbinoliphilus subsp. oakridgensis TaxID=694327 RepID=G7Q407_9BACT|nr:cyclase family protein [Solidesulfovibrio carbinoliphilus]EHJ46797.1 Arylformamidase [Solidesulfovibrio carbinoliphilus subsp. oakridgensis]